MLMSLIFPSHFTNGILHTEYLMLTSVKSEVQNRDIEEKFYFPS